MFIRQLKTLAEREAQGRPIDLDEVVRLLYAAGRAAAGGLPPAVAEETVQEVVQRMEARWRAGRYSLEDVTSMLSTAILNQGRTLIERERRQAGVSFDAVVDGRPSLADQVPGTIGLPEEQLMASEKLGELRDDFAALKAYLDKATPIVRFVEKRAAEGAERRQIAMEASQAGLETSEAAVRQIVRRLNERFPSLRGRWANRAPSGTGGREGRARRRSSREAKAALQQAAAEASSAVELIHEMRTKRERVAWDEIAATLQLRLGEHWDPRRARNAWAAFVNDLPKELRHVAP